MAPTTPWICTRPKCKEQARRHIGRSRWCERHYQEWLAARCTETVYGARGSSWLCNNKATVILGDGKKYCSRHWERYQERKDAIEKFRAEWEEEECE